MGAMKEMLTESEELVQHLQAILLSDPKFQHTAHEHALAYAYPHCPESIRYQQWQDEQELNYEPPTLKLYWATRTNFIQTMLGQLAGSLYYWEKK